MTSKQETFEKLENLKLLKDKMSEMSEKRDKMRSLYEDVEEESDKLQEYKQEVQMLHQEKMAHVEELRLIHTDINTMENVVKQSSVECTSKMQQILQMMSELQPITSEIDTIRCELGLNKSDSGGSVESFDSHYNRVDRLYKKLGNPHRDLHPSFMTSQRPTTSSHFTGFHQSDVILGDVIAERHASQPPPMKTCMSCHQQIHRNAPICPLCKAKSRSKNPKRSKKSSVNKSQQK